jgi:nucleotide-binding universal stress UspA family protein
MTVAEEVKPVSKRRVLIPLDGSEFSERIIAEVLRFIHPNDNELVLLRIAHAPSGVVGRPARPASADVPVPMFETSTDAEYALHPVYASQEWDSLLTRINDDLEIARSSLQGGGYTVYTATKFGEPGPEIVEFVEDENIDLVAMATHTRSGLSRLLLGSVAEYVLRNVSVPVLLLRSSEEANGSPLSTEALGAGFMLRG